MIFNVTINHLKSWCINEYKSYNDPNKNYGGISSVIATVLWELEFKLSTLMDREFADKEDFRNQVSDLIDVHYERSLIKPQNNIASRMIEKINDKFRFVLSDSLYNINISDSSSLPYRRVIIGDEAEELIKKFKSVWEYENTEYWFPLAWKKYDEIGEKFYVTFDDFADYIKEIEEELGIPQIHIYEYNEADFWPDHVIETAQLAHFGSHETFYTDKDFTWAIYYSHEDTVSFAGSIVPRMKDILINKRDQG